MNIHQIHSRLAEAIRRRAKIEQYLACEQNLVGRIAAHLCQVYVRSHISRLTYQLRLQG